MFKFQIYNSMLGNTFSFFSLKTILLENFYSYLLISILLFVVLYIYIHTLSTSLSRSQFQSSCFGQCMHCFTDFIHHKTLYTKVTVHCDKFTKCVVLYLMLFQTELKYNIKGSNKKKNPSKITKQ